MRRCDAVVAFCLQFLCTANAAQAAFQPGDILLNVAGSRVQQFRGDGTLVHSFTPTGVVLEGATPIGNEKFVTTHRSPVPGVNIVGSDGAEFTFDLLAGTVPGDVSVFSDGTLAVSDQTNGRILYYSQAGSFLTAASHPDFANRAPFGSAVASDNTLWVAAALKPDPTSSALYHFSSDGSFLGKTPLPFTTYEIAIDPVDGTFWLPNGSGGTLYNFSPGGVELSHFVTAVGDNFYSVAAASDGSVFVSGVHETSVYHYGRAGEFLGSFNIGTSGKPIFMSIVAVPEPTTLPTAILATAYFMIKRRRCSKQRCVREAKHAFDS
jgi:hypothetical protein